MSYSVYESINTDRSDIVNAFVASIQNSTFHWHNEYELIGVLKGKIQERVQSRVITLNQGDILLVNPNEIHAIKSIGEEENLCMVIQIKPELLVVERDEDTSLRFYLDSTSDEEVECGYKKFFYQIARIIYETMKEEKYAVFRARAEVYNLIADLFDYVVYDVRFRDVTIQNYEELSILAIEYMESHLEEQRILELICHEFGISRKTLDRNLKMAIGLTGKEVLDNLRIEKAKKLLKNTEKNMSYILDSCGFGSEKTFYRTFRQETGLTPKEFREKGQFINYSKDLKGYLDIESLEIKEYLRKLVSEDIERN